jgi:hypothetical protein
MTKERAARLVILGEEKAPGLKNSGKTGGKSGDSLLPGKYACPEQGLGKTRSKQDAAVPFAVVESGFFLKLSGGRSLSLSN